MPGSFFDTNVLLYLASRDARKADRAEELLSAGGAISVQVLNEFANVARRKMQLSWSELRTFLDELRAAVSVHPLTVDVHTAGLLLAERYRLSIFDAMIAASALAAGCDVLWSEDLQHGMLLDGSLRVIDPFSG
jgi:predicted nucleic acid-binding protein